MTLEEYAISKIKELELQNKVLAEDLKKAVQDLSEAREDHARLKNILRRIGTHRMSSIYECPIIDLSTVSRKFDEDTYNVLSTYFDPIDGGQNEEEARNTDSCEER